MRMRTCLGAALYFAASSHDIFVHPDGTEGARGDFESPVKSVQTCVDALQNPGDRCLLKAGTYYFDSSSVLVNDKQGTSKAPMVVGAAGDGPVIFDGTKDVLDLSTDRTWRSSKVGSHVYELSLSKGTAVWQLFSNDAGSSMEMQVPARWPNAKWSDKTLMMGPEHWAHSGPQGSGTHDPVKTGKGVLQDIGKCNKTSDCCSLCNGNSLADSGVNATGAIVIMNAWGNGVGLEKIKNHKPGTSILEYDATWCKEEIQQRGKCSDGYHGGQGRYYLEGSLELLDAPEEWVVKDDTLYYYPPSGKTPADGSVRAKVSTYALNITGGTEYVTFANISFFATALTARSESEELNNLRFESLDFSYPAASKRTLGDFSPEETVLVWTNNARDKKMAWTNHSFIDVAFRYSDGCGLAVAGGGLRFENCIWEWNSWAGMASADPDGWGTGGTLSVKGAETPGDVMFTRLTFRNNGASKVLRPPSTGTTIELVDFDSQLQLANDGCMVETGGETSATMRYNWAHDSGKAAYRFDGDDGSGTANGEMSFNVAWNVSNLIVKGDKHNITGNTAFDGSDIGASFAAHSLPGYQDADSPLDFCTNMIVVENPGQTTEKADTHSVFSGNIFDRVEAWKDCDNADCPFAGSWDKSNVIGSSPNPNNGKVDASVFDIKAELRDPWNRDFRPCPGSRSAKSGAGAYKPYSNTDSEYWIPGALEQLPSKPSPRDAGIKVPIDAELLFLQSYRAISHKVYFGTADALNKIATLKGKENIVRPGKLESKTRYAWRVDAVMPDGATRKGNVWTFTTGSSLTCSSGKESIEGNQDSCTTELDSCCSDVKWEGSKCVNHVSRHNDTLVNKGQCTWADEAEYCYACGGLLPRSENRDDSDQLFFATLFV